VTHHTNGPTSAWTGAAMHRRRTVCRDGQRAPHLLQVAAASDVSTQVATVVQFV
jgi:hypothetical protein